MTELVETGRPDGADLGDLELIEAARANDDAAVGELYRRHRGAALRLAQRISDPVTAEDVVAEAFVGVFASIRAGKGPSVAFRPYLLRAVRNAHVNHIRRNSRFVLTDEDQEPVGAARVGDDLLERTQESRLLAEAFSSLPERWQAVIWHTTVEGDDHETVGRLLGIKANAVAALNFRAREGLRRAYLAAHLAAASPEGCRPTRDQLPAYVRGRLGPRQRRPVEEHLRGCRACTAAQLELGTVNSDLGAVLAPAVLGTAGVGYAGLHLGTGLAGLLDVGVGLPARLARLVQGPGAMAATSTAVVTLVVVTGLVVRGPDEPRAIEPDAAGLEERHVPSTAGPTPVVPPVPPPSAPRSGPTAGPTPTPTAGPTPPPTAPPSSTPAPTRSPLPPPELTETPVTPPRTPTPHPSPTPTPTPSPTPPAGTTEDLVLGSASHAYYDPHYHLQLDVTTPLDPTTLTFEVAGLVGFEVHQDLGFPGTTCTAGAPVGERTTITCALAAGTGTFAIDVVVDGPLDVTARLAADGNTDPHPADNVVIYTG